MLWRSSASGGLVGSLKAVWAAHCTASAWVSICLKASTSSGRGYTAQGQAQRTDSGLVISRSIATNSGRSASYTRTYPARRAD